MGFMVNRPVPIGKARPNMPNRPHIAIVLAVAFGGVLSVSLIATLLLGLETARSNTSTLLEERIRSTLDAVEERVERHLETVKIGVLHARAVIESGEVEVSDPTELSNLISAAIAATPQVSGVAFVRPDRQAVLVRNGVRRYRLEDWSKFHYIDGLFERSLATREPIWTGPVWYPPLQASLLSLLIATHRGDHFLGVLASSVLVDELSAFAAELSEKIAQTVFILKGADTVMAHPLLPGVRSSLSPERPLPSRTEVGDPILAVLWDTGVFPPPTPALPIGTDLRRSLSYRGESYIALLRVVAYADGLPVLAGTWARSALFDAELRRLWLMAVAGLGILVAAVATSLLLGRRISGPLRRLAAAAEQVRTRQYEDVPTLPPTWIHEIDEASQSFNVMVAGLRERQRLRDLFGRYVAPAVVETVLKDPQTLRLVGERREISLLFTDIVGFTSISESCPPEQIVGLLNQYLETVCRIITEQGGIVVDFIGDAVFAIFGAPILTADHSRQAVSAALAIDRFAVAFSAQAHATGLPFGLTRLAVHTGTVLVGNVGSLERLKYGATGDAVNTASRLEGANRVFGTRLLVSDAAARQACDRGWDYRPLGILHLKGRAGPVAVSEPIAIDRSGPWLNRYRVAYGAIGIDPPTALAAFEELATERPDDPVVAFHATRLRDGVASPDVTMASK